MKGLYGRLFDWIVRKVNVCMAGDINTEGNSSSGSQGDACVVGILDIFGFEIFEHNSFEQLWVFKRRSIHREWSTVDDIFLPPPYFKSVSLSLSRSPLF